jgi:hypothetical protein
LAVNNIGASGIISTNQIKVQNDITCSTLRAKEQINYDFRMIGFFNNISSYGSIPICKTIPLASNFCGGSINLTTIFATQNVLISLIPTYKIVMYDSYGVIVFTANNTTGNDIAIYTTSTGLSVYKIIVFNNNIPVL